MNATDLDYTQPYASQRAPVMARNIVATSQPLAAQAGLSMLAQGGNAVDAAIAAAMVLTVVEPTGCGLGSDAFALVWAKGELHGLNASGRSPAAYTPERFAGRQAMPIDGWDPVTVPGAVSGWIALHDRFGALALESVAAPAIRYARDGFAVSPLTAAAWAASVERLKAQPGFAETFLPGGRAPKPGEIFRSPGHAATLEAIVATRGDAFYRGSVAAQIADFAKQCGAPLTGDDLAVHTADWVTPISHGFGDAVIHEIPPNGQGIAALMALGMLEARGLAGGSADDPAMMHRAIEAMKLALADLYHHVGDAAAMRVAPDALLDPTYLRARAKLIDPARAGDPGHGTPQPGGTVYLATADASGMMVSFIQSNYMGFGSGVVVPGTGISLQNRGAGFVLTPGHVNQIGPRKRPFHTIIPGFATTRAGQPLMAFGVMGGPIQAQGHVQMALRILRDRQNPQAAIDAPRWRVESGRRVAVEAALPAATVAALREYGHSIEIVPHEGFMGFGGAQIILRDGATGYYVAGSDPRKDGQAVGF